MWCPTFCVGIRAIDWSTFSSRLLPQTFRLVGLGHTYISRNAGADMITSAAVVAAEHQQLKGEILHRYLELCQDTDVVIRKAALSNLKLLFQRVAPSEVEALFYAEACIES